MSFRHTPYHMLLEAFAGTGCPICEVVDMEVLRYLDQLLHAHVNDLDFRAELRASMGFCPTHAWWLVRRCQGAALGATVMYRDVLNQARRRLSEATGRGSVLSHTHRFPLARLLSTRTAPHPELYRGCPACQIRDRVEGAFVSTLISHAHDERFLDRYAESNGICLIHLEQTITAAHGTRTLQRLLDKHAAIMDRLLAELDEFQRKADYRFQAETVGDEGDAWQRAITLLAGKDRTR
jgi:hypothetical protein